MVVSRLLMKNAVNGFLYAEFGIVHCFPGCSIHCVNMVRFIVLMFQRVYQQHVEEQESILEMVQRGPTTNTRRLPTYLGVSLTLV
jgi:hypothetical protein